MAQKKHSNLYIRRRRRARRRKVLYLVIILVVILIVIFAFSRHRNRSQSQQWSEPASTYELTADGLSLDVQLLTPNSYSRPGTALEKINGIVVHYTANQGSSAQANRNYFEGLKDTQETKASSHFVIGLDGEIIQCIPTSEIAYASNNRNSDTVSIECCYENNDGSFNKATYDSLIRLTAWLCAREGLSSEDVIRHYDVTGKLCPIYYVENPESWDQLRADVQAQIEVYRDVI